MRKPKTKAKMNPVCQLSLDNSVAPDYLDEVAQKYWVETLEYLVTKGMVDDIDLGSFAAMCEAYSEYVRTLVLLDGKVPMIETEKGNWIQHPLLGVKNKAAERYMKFAKEFGMTPQARAKLADASVNAADKLKKYFE